jgi:hypothetical protein
MIERWIVLFDGWPLIIRHIVLLPLKLISVYLIVSAFTFFLTAWASFNWIGWWLLTWGTVLWSLIHLARDVQNGRLK